MKFKKDKTFDEPARTLTQTDYEGDVLTVSVFNSKCQVVFGIEGTTFGTTKAKALKLAWAIIDELEPDWETAF